MSKKLTLQGKSVEISDEDADSFMHLGVHVALGVFDSVWNSEPGKQLRGPQRGHAPRVAQETRVAQNKSTAADRLHDVVAKMRELRGQK